MSRLTSITLAVACAALGAACDRDVPADVSVTTKQVTDEAIKQNVDLLFVIDNSGGGAQLINSLDANFINFMNLLSTLPGGLPNIHVGIVTSDVGAGPYNIPGCTGNGDNGMLQSAPQLACEPPTGAFIQDVEDPECTDPDPDNCRIRNYTDPLADTFTCIIPRSGDGCGFEQPMESVLRALDGRNPGFLREDAALGIVFISDEDDCSVNDTALFDTSLDAELVYGPLGSFRCFEFGVECDGWPPDPGPQANCAPRENTEVNHPRIYAASYKNIKGDAPVFVSAIVGDTAPVNVGLDEFSNRILEPSCTSQNVPAGATPGIRFAALVDEFPTSGTRTSACDEDLSDAILSVAQALTVDLDGICLPEDIWDADETIAGVQAECDVVELSPSGDRDIPSCDDSGGDRPCYVVEDNASCTGGGFLLRIERDAPVPDNSRLSAGCLVREELRPATTATSYYECTIGHPGAARRGTPWFAIAIAIAALFIARRRSR